MKQLFPGSKPAFVVFFLLIFQISLSAQTNVRAWYRDGQVWIVWEAGSPLPDWYTIYASPTPFSNINQATWVGRPHKFEYGLFSLKEQLDTSATARIPAASGNAKYQLGAYEAIFVYTPHQAGALYFAVVAEGETAVTPGQNITANAVQFQYDPANDPVECHLQSVFPSPFASGFTCLCFMMWADGRQNQWESRPDFPVMANAAKNGMPSLFFVSVPNDLDTTQPFPLSIWLHGGGGTARQSLAGSRAEINIKPEAGVLLSHDDTHVGWHDTHQPNPEAPSWHFGWRKNYDPFNPDNVPTAVDTIVNYTQRRYLWIDDWLIKHYNIDPTRIHIHGHSMGSAGATALAKCYPEHYASVTIFNNGCGGPTSDDASANFGPADDNYPTCLKNKAGETVRINSVFNMIDNCAPARDLPVFRHWHAKNDDNGTMQWDAYVVENFHTADSLGMGFQSMWSERSHGVDTGPDYNDHWVSGIPADQQTALDNVNFPESRFRSNQSFPAFFNHRLDPKNNDPGTGLIGINNGDGDNWGAWGGYHRWNTETLLENIHQWGVEAWLEANAIYANDNCPNSFLTSDVAIRRPQLFKPATGSVIHWKVFNGNDNSVLQSGTAIVQPDNVVVIPGVRVYREDLGRVRILVTDIQTATQEAGEISNVFIAPNPAADHSEIVLNVAAPGEITLAVLNVEGKKMVIQNHEVQPGENRLSLPDDLPAGMYLISIESQTGRQTLPFIKI